MSRSDADSLARTEAEARAGRVRDIAYRIDLDLAAGAETYRGDATVEFAAATDADVFIEFSGGAIARFELNGREAQPHREGARIILPGRELGERNEVRVVYETEYDHTGEGFHQFVDPEDGGEYLYTGFEPYQAHRVFPCFDQPDLKATFELAVTAPEAWEVISAGRLLRRDPADADRTRRSYERTLPFSTYLFPVVAGPYHRVADEHRGLPLGLFCRSSLVQALDAGAILEVTKCGLDWFAEFFGKAYPFTKYDQIFVPEFNWGGMENVAAVTYTDNLIFRDPPTRSMVTRRAEVLLHELAHMWFGNLVTMRWWDDLWLNESFATYAAYMAMDGATDFADIWLGFHTRNKPGAYRADELPTTHPIVADVATTSDTFLNFDEITYGKGGAALHQLVATVGDAAFRKGIQTYFRRHEFGNTTLPEFLAAVQEGAGKDLVRWASRWLTTTGINTLDLDWSATDGTLTEMRLSQTAPDSHPTLRPHTVEIALYYDDPGGLRVESRPATVERAAARVAGVAGLPEPVLAFPNHRDLTFCKVTLDRRSLGFVEQSLARIPDPLSRQLLWSSLWSMLRDRAYGSPDFIDLVLRHLPAEHNQEILRDTSLRANAAVSRYLPEEMREDASRRLVAAARAALDTAPEGDARVYWARALIRAASVPDDLELAGRVVDEAEGIAGLSIDREMRWSVAAKWSAYGVPGSVARIAAAAARDPSDRGLRSRLAAETSAPDSEVKATAWKRVHARGYRSLHEASAAMRGFQWDVQSDLLATYATEFFARVEEVFASWEWEEARSYFDGLFPRYRVDEGTLGMARHARDGAADARLQRLLAEAVDDLERALAVRRYAAAMAAETAATGETAEGSGTGTMGPR